MAEIAAGRLTALEAVEAHIARIEAVNPALNAVVVPLFDDARQRARAADEIPKDKRGLLHGLPVTGPGREDRVLAVMEMLEESAATLPRPLPA